MTGRKQSKMIRRALFAALSAVLAPTLVVVSGCSSDSSDSGPSTPSLSVDETFSPRSPGDNILGENRPDGTCSPDVIDINHSKYTAHFIYNGQPGVRIKLEIILKDKSPQEESFELGSTNTQWQVPTDIYNGDIAKVIVTADGRVGKPGSCIVPVS